MTDLDKIEKCEFGNGLTYCLGMFLAHAEKLEENKKVFNNAGITDKNQAVHMWMNASSDHLYGLYIHAEAPFSLNLQKRILSFRSKVLNWGHGSGFAHGQPDRGRCVLGDWRGQGTVAAN